MSGTVGSLTDTERTDARRFMGYPAYGAGNSGGGFQSYRFFTAYGQMEYRLNNITATELVVVRAKLAELVTLDTAIAGAGANLDTDQAAVWYRNKNEPRDRKALFNDRRRELCEFMGVPFGPSLTSPASVRVIV